MKSNQLAQESFWGSIVTYIGVSIGFLTTFFILATYLSPEEVGFTRIIVEISTLLSGLGMLGLSTSISRYYPYFHDDTGSKDNIPNRGFFFWILCITGIGLAITLPLYGFGASIINQYLGKGSQLLSENYLSIIPLTLIITLWAVIELYTIQLMHLAIPRVIRELVLRLLLILAYTSYALHWVSFNGFITLFIGSYGLCLLAATFYLSRVTTLSLRRVPEYPTKELKKSFISYTSLAILTVVGTTLAGRMDMLMLAFLPSEGLRSNAVFTIGFFMVSIVEISTRAIIGLATAQIAKLMKDKLFLEVGRLYEQVSRFQLLSSLIIYMSIYVSIEEIISLMPSSQAYTASKDVFLILGISKLIEVTFTACHPIINTSQHYQWSLYYTLWSILVAFFANLYLIPMWGTAGAATATALTTLLGYTLLQTIIYRRLGIHPFSIKLFGCCILGGLLFFFSLYLPHIDNQLGNILLRSGLIASLGLLLTLLLRLAPEGELFIINGIKKTQLWKTEK